ncbi:HET-domain-containing protein [Stipitochalara longipes BDJ]|nr:HET-domain-containing protein [Stipitochalara longipes BDJ]
MVTPNYLYTSLSDPYSIRVLILKRANKFDDALFGSLQEVTLPAKSPIQFLKEKAIQLGCQNLTELPDEVYNTIDNSPRVSYDALSYVWGAKSENISIVCDKKSIAITKNCDEALRYIRRHNEDRMLWVDAICINQSSDAEKSRQVELMGHIYKSASTVTIWLGPSTVDVNVISTEARWGKWFRDTLPVVVSRNILGPPELEREMIPAITKSPWYTRIWTFQEQILPVGTTYVKWGEYEMDYISFQQMRNTWHEEKEMYESKRTDIHRAYKNIFQQLNPPKRQLQHLWMQILHTGRLLQCFDSRDRLYGLFGILQESGMSVPRPDYSISVQSVFEDFIRHIIRAERSLWVLICTLGNKRNIQLPSWVADWTVNDPENNLAIYQAMELVFGPYNATMSSNVDLELLSTGVSPPGKLTLKGRLVYEIVASAGKFSVLTPNEYGKTDIAIPQFIDWFLLTFFLGGLNALERLRLLFWSSNRKATKWDEHEFQTIISSFFYEVRSSGYSFDQTDATTYQAMIQAIAGGDPREEPWKSKLGEVLDSRDGNKFIRRVWYHFHGATLFSDAFANLGVSWATLPETMLTEEAPKKYFVALLAGCNVPVVLSRCVHGEMYEILGPAFVPGIMHSEAWPRDAFTDLSNIVLH